MTTFRSSSIANGGVVDAALLAAQTAIQPGDWDEPSGFESPDLVGVAYDAGERKVTLTQDNGVVYWWRGAKHILTSPWTSTAHDAGNGSFFLSSDGEEFTWATDLAWSFDQIQVCVAIVTTGFTFAIRECHGLMPWQTHRVLHSQIGTFRVSGGGAAEGSFTLNSDDDDDIVPGFAQGVIMDEDVPSTIAARASGDYKLLHVGADGVSVFTDATFPFFVAVSGDRITINEVADGLLTLEAATNRFVNIYQIMVPVTSEAGSQAYRMVMLQPQAQYTTLAAAQAEDFRSLSIGSLGTLAPEMVAYTRLTYHTASHATTGHAELRAVGYLAGNRASQVAISFAGVSAENVGYTAGVAETLTATNVAAALDELYALIDALGT